MNSYIDISDTKMVGTAVCEGGSHPSPPINDFPLLIWNGVEVWTEDGKATVEQLAWALPEMPCIKSLASRYGTTQEHVFQALAYAVKASQLGGK